MNTRTRNTAELRNLVQQRQARNALSMSHTANQTEQYQPSAKPWDGQGNSIELRQSRAQVLDSMYLAVTKAEAEKRNLHKEESEQFDVLERRYNDLTRGIAEAEASERNEAENARSLTGAGLPGGNVNGSGRQQKRDQGPARLTASQSVVEHLRSRGNYNQEEANLSFDGFVRGMSGRGWKGYENEQRALTGLTDPSGGILIPESVSANIIDLARAKSVVTQAGAQTVPMDARTVTVPRLDSDLTVEWLPELAQQDDASASFGAMTLRARTVRAWALLSEEIVEDVDSLEGFISQQVATAIAAEIDRVALFGDPAGNANTEEPMGLLKTPGVPTLAAPASGTPTWADLVRSQTILRNANHEPTASISNPLVEEFLSLQTAADGQFISPPAALANLPRLTSSKVPIQADKSHLILGDFKRLVIGWRSQIKMKVSDQFAMDRNAVAVRISARVDIGVERANAFHIREVNTAAAAG